MPNTCAGPTGAFPGLHKSAKALIWIPCAWSGAPMQRSNFMRTSERSLSNGIQSIRENGFGRENIPAMMAAVVVISLPLIVLFLIFRKKIMAGVARGGTKG